ncbi:hypothetical protein E2C01_026826 [Portunus trituberculatus]|uniref:Uncharacterized protein n=1 Tax=Portunus trituberculatus TaxID=210409 RepID=A0A5B7EJ81_PORTR|nr:hypothetical protein [Portunus trituberculatus]
MLCLAAPPENTHPTIYCGLFLRDEARCAEEPMGAVLSQGLLCPGYPHAAPSVRRDWLPRARMTLCTETQVNTRHRHFVSCMYEKSGPEREQRTYRCHGYNLIKDSVITAKTCHRQHIPDDIMTTPPILSPPRPRDTPGKAGQPRRVNKCGKIQGN